MSVNMKKNYSALRYLCGEILFYIHLPIFLAWGGLFFVPVGLWPGRVAFHFYFIMTTVVIQIVGGVVYCPITKRFDLVCILSVLMQWVRGCPLPDPSSYKHSFIIELFERVHIRFHKKTLTVLIIVSVILVVCQYFFSFPLVF